MEFCNGIRIDEKNEVHYLSTSTNMSCPLIAPEFKHIPSTWQSVMPATPSVSDYRYQACAVHRVETICFFLY